MSENEHYGIRRLILDVLKPHKPSLMEVASKLSKLPGIIGVNCSLDEVDQETENIKVIIEGVDIDFESVEKVLEECSAVIHSVDNVVAGKKLVENVETLQDR